MPVIPLPASPCLDLEAGADLDAELAPGFHRDAVDDDQHRFPASLNLPLTKIEEEENFLRVDVQEQSESVREWVAFSLSELW